MGQIISTGQTDIGSGGPCFFSIRTPVIVTPSRYQEAGYQYLRFGMV